MNKKKDIVLDQIRVFPALKVLYVKSNVHSNLHQAAPPTTTRHPLAFAQDEGLRVLTRQQTGMELRFEPTTPSVIGQLVIGRNCEFMYANIKQSITSFAYVSIRPPT